MDKKPVLIVALDVPKRENALTILSKLPEKPDCPIWVKVGLELFVAAGPSLLSDFQKDYAFPIFLDLKFYDIPNTVKGACRSATKWGVQMMNLHAAGGEAMAVGALEGREEGLASVGVKPYIMAVTILTSQDGDSEIVTEKVVNMALAVKRWGLDGVVCSAREASAVKSACGHDFFCLCPGIRPVFGTINDQARVCTPAQAVESGADFLVVGRPIIQAENPRNAAEAILTEMYSSKRIIR